MGSVSAIVKDGEVVCIVGAGEWDEMVAAIKGGRLVRSTTDLNLPYYSVR
jgi:hypothetical protein